MRANREQAVQGPWGHLHCLELLRHVIAATARDSTLHAYANLDAAGATAVVGAAFATIRPAVFVAAMPFLSLPVTFGHSTTGASSFCHLAFSFALLERYGRSPYRPEYKPVSVFRGKPVSPICPVNRRKRPTSSVLARQFHSMEHPGAMRQVASRWCPLHPLQGVMY